MKTVDVLAEHRIHNSWNLLDHGEYLVNFTSYFGQGRFPTKWGWYLHKKGFKFKASTHWADGGDLKLRTENDTLIERDVALRQAADHTGSRVWARDPFGGWHPAPQLRAHYAMLGIKTKPTEVTV